MTSPLAQGFPDWQRNRPAANVLFLETGIVTTGLVNYGPFFVGYTEGLGIDIEMSAGTLSTSIFWQLDINGNALVNNGMTTATPGGFSGVVKTRGPWVSFSVVPGGATATYRLRLYAAPQPGMTPQSDNDCHLITTTFANLAAGATVTYTANKTWWGAVYVAVEQVGGPYDVTIGDLDFNLIRQTLDRHDSSAGQRYQSNLYVGPRPIQVAIHNQDAAAHNHTVVVNGLSTQAW